jgi:hypothetical protein
MRYNKLFFKLSINDLKVLGMGISLVLYTTHPCAQQPTSVFNNSTVSLSQDKAQAYEQQRKQAEEKTNQALVPDAITAIKETRNAVEALSKGQQQEALTAIERAIGKLDILLANHPEEALLPVDFNIQVIDLAPLDIKLIKEMSSTAEQFMKSKDYPNSRLILDILRSEIHIRISSLPLALYSTALKRSAALLEEKKTDESNAVLLSALNTLVIRDQILPLPLINAEIMIKAAEKEYEKDKGMALKLIASVRHEIERLKELGYRTKSKGDQYNSLEKAIQEFEKQLKTDKNVTSPFGFLSAKLKALLKGEYEEKKQFQSQPKR